MRPFVDFYRANGISPVTQDISDLDRHFQRREALYRHLGLVPAWLAGRRVIEFGPGSGYNALYTASLDPAAYLLVDGNPTGLARARELLDAYGRGGRVRLAEALIEEFDTPERYDLVLCEGTIPFQLDPGRFLQAVARFAAPGGVVVTTCVDGVSMLAESLRRLLARLLVPREADVARAVARLLPVFSPHLATLQGMSRPHEDWVLDQLVQPLPGRLFAIAEAIDALDDTFDVLGTSPRFLTDWRWYKDIHGDARTYNQVAREAYWRGLHNFIDYRIACDPRPVERNRRLLQRADRVFRLVQDYEARQRPQTLASVRREVLALSAACRGFAPEVGMALRDYLRVYDHLLQVGELLPFGAFAGLFGRGQQYLSLVRRG